MIRRAVALVLVATTASAHGALAQRPSRPSRPPVLEARVDGFAGREVGAQLGGGIAFDAGNYLRLAIVGGAGAEQHDDGVVVGVQRIEGVARFHVDPYRQGRRGLYLGGGLGARHAEGRVRPTLVALLGVEGRPRRGVTTAVELGVGGGARLGIVLRGARRGRR